MRVPILAGQTLTAGVLNRLQPKTYRAKQTSAINNAQSAADLPGVSVTFTTETAGAKAVAEWFVDARNLSAGAAASAMFVYALLDGVTSSDTYAGFRGSAASEQANVSACMDFTIAAAGSHTIKLQTNQVLNHSINVYTSLLVTVYEVV